MSDWSRAQWDYFVTTAPTEEPLTLAEVKDFLRIDITDDDTYITNTVIPGVRLCAESITKRIMISTEFETFRNGFGEDKSFRTGGKRPIVLRKSPYISTTSFTYKTDDGTSTLTENTDFFVEKVGDYSKLRPEDLWPSDNKRREQSIIVKFRAGYADAASVPKDLKQAMLQHSGFMYQNRGDCECDIDSATSAGAMGIYQKYRILEV